MRTFIPLIISIIATGCTYDISMSERDQEDVITDPQTDPGTLNPNDSPSSPSDNGQNNDDNNGGSQNDPPTEEPEEDDDPICGWSVFDGNLGGNQVYVESIPTYTLNSPSASAYPGLDIDLRFSVEADPCGDLELMGMFIVAQDPDGNPWLYEVHQNGTASTLWMQNVGTLAPIWASNMNVTPSGDELHYEWCVPPSGGEWYGSTQCNESMSPYLVPAGEVRHFTFTFSSSHLAPSGSQWEIYVAEIVWRDVTTGELIRDWSAYDELFMPVTTL